MKAELSEDGQSFTLTRGAWSNSYPLADLPKWLAFYRKQPLDFPKSGDSYAASIAALEALAARLGQG
ncbi:MULTISPECIES: hypothetical protein [Gemmobacter]|uniref:Uncharacterized protein n=2 Tax=Gemmobacter TaxID=204456 RepID=A0A2T6BB15_9RHOB|nr:MULTISPECIES: hypothetical protein [Gemmobacter]OJY27574.1 MAG: hypothetical protein BGP11_14190 [Rhodobacterales bacterium 65-51]PTX53281.1 hypothetical protein C8N34_101196 [Gemmobacter caeni]TWJ05392.1 hypothetical protein IQ03_00194 [Gemmobacter caeni]GHC16285.1 hypothetical protein GCM10007291_13380 [Gemmobacter nanjingensis]